MKIKTMCRVSDFWQSLEPVIENMLLRDDAAELDALERPEVLGYLPPLEGLAMLDLGAGIGRFTGEFAKKAAHVTALDFVPQFIEQNRINNSDFSNVTYLCSDITKTDFQEHVFDLIFVSGVFMYLEDEALERVVLNLSKWLKPGGYLFFRDCCSPHAKTVHGPYSLQRPIYHYHKLMDPLFTYIDSGSIQVFIDRFANPFRCYWLYKNFIKSVDELI